MAVPPAAGLLLAGDFIEAFRRSLQDVPLILPASPHNNLVEQRRWPGEVTLFAED